MVGEQGLNDMHFDAVTNNLASTLTEMGVNNDLISEVAAIAETTRKGPLGR